MFSEDYYEAILSNRWNRLIHNIHNKSPMMAVVIKADRIVRFCPQEFCEFSGYQKDEILSGSFDILNLIDDDFGTGNFKEKHTLFLNEWFKNPRDIEMHIRGPLPIIKKDKSKTWALIEIRPYIDVQYNKDPTETPIEFIRFAIVYIFPLPLTWYSKFNIPIPDK